MAAPVGDVEALQLALDLEPGPVADTPPPCRCCRGRRNVPCAPLGWTSCTWCEGSGVDPESIAPRRPARPGPARELELERLAS
jgi:hypothetical protein